MIHKLPTKLDLESILAEVVQIDFWKDDSEVEMCVRQSDGIPFRNATAIMSAVGEIGLLRLTPPLHLMINRMPPKVLVPKHRDFLKASTHQQRYPTLERWHLPIVTNEGAWWWDEQHGRMLLPAGFWYGPMPYWLEHQIGNDGNDSRIHLIVDLDSPEPIGFYKD